MGGAEVSGRDESVAEMAILACRECGHEAVYAAEEMASRAKAGVVSGCRGCGKPMRVRLLVPSTALSVWSEEAE